MEKTTKIKGLLFALAFLFSLNINAQDAAVPSDPENYDQGWRLGFGANVGYVFDDPYDLSLGGDVRLQYDLSTRYSFVLTTGFTNLFVGDDMKDLGFIPAKLGFKAFVWEDQFYVLAEAGAAFAVTNGYDKTSLVLSPGIGYATKNLDLSLRYEHYNDFPVINSNGTTDEGTGQIALRIAYGFRL